MHVLSASTTVAGFPLRHLLSILAIVRDAVAAASGRSALDCVCIPEEVTEVNPRTRRLVRQAQVSPW